jgi:hypothetical protein
MLKIGSLLITKEKNVWVSQEILLVVGVGYCPTQDCYYEDREDLGYQCSVIGADPNDKRWFSCKYIDEVGLKSWIII